MARRESRAPTFLWFAAVLLIAAPCARAPEPFGSNAALSRAEVDDPDVEAVRAQLVPLDRQIGATECDALASALVAASREHDLPPAFVLAVIEVESRFDPYAVSPVGALGLMQILPSTGAPVARRLGIGWRGPQTLFDPRANVRIGVAYLRELIDRYANVRAALAAYNWGPGEIDARLRNGTVLPVTYVERVLDAYSNGRRTDS